MAIEPGVVTIEHRDGAVLVRLLGEHDLYTSDKVREALYQQIEAGDGLVVSLAEADFIDASVLRALCDADATLQEHGRRVVLHVSTAPPVQRVLELSGLPSLLPCFSSIDEALGHANTIGGRT
jgi:anti-anti-sigma factor